MNGFVFNDQTHEYFYNDRRIPSVTEIIGTVIARKWTPDEWYMERGTAIHKAIALRLKGTLDESTIDLRIIGQFKAAKKALETFQANGWNLKTARFEQPLYSPLGFAGTPDAIFLNGIVVDWKSSIEPTVEFQLGAYTILDGFCSGKAYAVELSEDGTFKMQSFDVKAAQRLWMNLFSVYGWMSRHGLTNKKEA